VVVTCVWHGPVNKCLFLLFAVVYGTDMSVSKATDSDRKSGVAVIKAEYVFMYLNCCNYNRHSFMCLYSLIHHWYLTSNIYPLRLYCSIYPIFGIICNIQNIIYIFTYNPFLH